MSAMVDDWAEEPEPRGLTRRRTLQLLGLAGGGALATSVVASSKSLLPPPIACRGEVSNRFYYAQPDPGQNVWWKQKGLVGTAAAITDFKLWEGAATTWRAVLDTDGKPDPACGFPAILIRVDANQVPVVHPPEFKKFVVDDTLDFGNGPERFTFVAIYDRCVHLCCLPGWHFFPVPSSFRDYAPNPDPRTFLASPSQDPIWCQCHNSQYDPVTLKDDVHPNGVKYVGATKVHGPAPRSLPAIPLKRDGLFLEGIYDPPDGHPEWYSAYCR